MLGAMKHIIPHALAGAAILALGACAGTPDLRDYAQATPTLALEEFFDGHVVAHGIFQDRFGELRRSFKVDVVGVWDGETLILTEDFVYEDASTERRVWTLTKTGPDTWTGTAPGVIGTAMGEEAGNAFNWRYTIDLPVPDGVLRANFDDWMWQLDEQVLINRAYVSKYGVEIGQLSITFRRDTPLGG
jgi:hypothetical protein